MVTNGLDYEQKTVYFFDILVEDKFGKDFTSAEANVQVNI